MFLQYKQAKGEEEKDYKSERTWKWTPHVAVSHPRLRFWADGPLLQHPSSGSIVLQRDVDSPRSLYTHMFLSNYFLKILGLTRFQNWFCAAWRFKCLFSTWPKGGLYALCPSPTSPHFFLFYLISTELPVPIWYKIVWNQVLKVNQIKPPWMRGLVEPHCCSALHLICLDSGEMGSICPRESHSNDLCWCLAFLGAAH